MMKQTTDQKLTKKLEKVVALAVKGATAGERQAATEALHRVCRKHCIRLTDYVAGLAEGFAGIDYREVQKEEAKQKLTSRRALIIKYVQEGIWDTASLAEYLTNFGYTDIKANKKAVAGTLYDMQKNKGWDIRHSDDGRICRV